MRIKSLTKSVSLIALLATGSVMAQEELTLYHNAKIWTGDKAKPTAEAMAIQHGKILAVGRNDTLMAHYKNAKKIDVMGQRLTPGFIDNHTHFMDISQVLSAVQLRDADSKQEFIKRISEYAKGKRPGEWIMGGIWDHEAWGGDLPRADWIDAVTPNNPVFLLRTDGHMAVANSLAMKAAGVNTATVKDVEGGEIVRNPDGTPTGIFKDNAMNLVFAAIPEMTEAQEIATFKQGIRYALSEGVTQIHDMGAWSHLNTFEAMNKANELDMRVYSFVFFNNMDRLKSYIAKHGRGDNMHRWGGLKAMVDGSLGSTTAWFYEPYSDEPDKSGFPITDPATFYQQIKKGDAMGMHVTVHAIGDKANDWLLDSFQKIEQENPANPHRRWRIEHAQHLTPAAIQRIADMGVIASMQPYHAIDDGRWAEKRIGPERIKQTYAFNSLMKAGATITFGSDAPVAPMTVMEGIYAAVTRRTLDGANPDGWVHAEKISVEQALTAYTTNNAYGGFQEDRLGMLKAGYLADFVTLDRDILSINPVQIKDTNVTRTVVNGIERFKRQ